MHGSIPLINCVWVGIIITSGTIGLNEISDKWAGVIFKVEIDTDNMVLGKNITVELAKVPDNVPMQGVPTIWPLSTVLNHAAKLADADIDKPLVKSVHLFE